VRKKRRKCCKLLIINDLSGFLVIDFDNLEDRLFFDLGN